MLRNLATELVGMVLAATPDYAGAAGERKPAAAAPHDALHREGRTTHPADV
jgi:hypothetical protein